MNPHRQNEFFVALTNSKVHIRASAICEADVVDVLSAYEELEIVTSDVSNFTHHVTAAPQLPQRARKRAFLKEIAKSVAGSTAGAIVTAVLIASCTVM